MTDEPTPKTKTVFGLTVDSSDEDCLRHAVELAFNYRGNVTITKRSTGQTVVGYVFDRTAGAAAGEWKIRMIPVEGAERVTIAGDDIAEIRFTGRDTAAGKSFETWMKKYVQKKLAGEQANIEPEPLDEKES